jgi:uncharacterized glyoxalase superfamily protein PhnB
VVKPIPDGYHSITPYLVVNKGVEAIEFYKRAFGAIEEYRHISPDGKAIVNAELRIGDSPILLSDEFSHDGGTEKSRSPKSIGGTAVIIHIYTEDVDKIFNQAISAGAKEVMPVTDMFWGDRYGQIVDPYGHIWSIATHKRDPSKEEIQNAAEAMFKDMASSKA